MLSPEEYSAWLKENFTADEVMAACRMVNHFHKHMTNSERFEYHGIGLIDDSLFDPLFDDSNFCRGLTTRHDPK